MKALRSRYFSLLVISTLVGAIGCSKIVQIANPTNTITASETYSSDASAISAISGIYSNMAWDNGGLCLTNGALTIFAGTYSDELIGTSYLTYNTYDNSIVLATDNNAYALIWQPAYYDIYCANAVIEGVQSSGSITPATKNQLIGEAKFIRAFCHFYLLNLFGAVPLDTTTSWTTNSLLPRSPSNQVYQQITADLLDAQNLMTSDFSLFGYQRVRATKWAAAALLARAYLYQDEWDSAYSAASSVINSGQFSLVTDLDSVFLANSNETILQLQISDNYPWATPEGNQIVPPDTTAPPTFYLTPQLLGAFEQSDLRRIHWVDSTDFNGTYYDFPYKYKVFSGSQGSIVEYYMLLRYAEQYLIRAEAEAHGAGNGAPGAIQDLNVIRVRAGLPLLADSMMSGQVLAAVQQERRIELFAELGHRWFDLKRTQSADSVMAATKPQYWTSADQLLWPIPAAEMTYDPNLKQNPGY